MHIIEIGYCSDTKYAEAYERKCQQHEELCKELAAHGWQVKVHTIMLGAYGTLYSGTWLG